MTTATANGGGAAAASATVSVDVAVIGAGTAGLAAYRAAKAHGARAVVVESGPYGTTCARVGCMPSKLLIAAADAAHRAREAEPFGVRASVAIDGRAVMDRVRRERDRFVGFVVDGVERIPETDRLRGVARFVAPGVLDVGGARVEARAVVLATGSAPYVPPFFEAVRDRLVVNDDVFDWDTLPESVAVFGTGVIGLELGQALARLGVRVRVFGRDGALGPLSDPAVKRAALDAFARELAIDTDARVRAVAPRGESGVEVTWEDEDGLVHTEVFASVLAATGRRPNHAGIGLEHAGVDLLARVDASTMRWGDAALFVAGDATGDRPLLHEAADEGAIAGENAARLAARGEVRRAERRAPLGIAFTDPNLAVVGPGYRALAAHEHLAVGEVSFADQGRSRVMRENKGALRVYADARTGRLLGAEIAGPRAEHLAHLLAWSLQQELTIARMLAMPFYHPVVEEGLRTALRDVASKIAVG